MAARILVYRKTGSSSRPVVRKADVEQIRRKVSIIARVQREGLLEHFIPAPKVSPFHRQPSLLASLIDNPALRRLEHEADGWLVPADSLGRKGEADRSQAQSIVLWLKKHVVDNGLANEDEISVVYEAD